MADDWQIGDLALCLRASPNSAKPHIPHPCVPGRSYMVERVVNARDGTLGLGFLGIVFEHCWLNADCAEHYRKITAPEADEFDRETIGLLNGEQVPA